MTETSHNRRSLLLRFLDGFLREQNIKWVLGLGMLILLGSSAMLIGSNWAGYSPTWKYLTMLGYTAVFAVAGLWANGGLGLKKTGAALMGLTVLMFPVLFFGLHQIDEGGRGQAFGVLQSGWGISLLSVTITSCWLITKRIFGQFLGGSQPTFLLAYVVLAVSGAFVPSLPEAASIPGALLCWAVFAAGSVKVNRHVFWLAEEHRAPRIYAFLPVLLLGGQFLALFSGFAADIDIEWLGTGCVLVSVPVLLTAEAVADVFRRRTGDLVRPLPVAISAPLFIGSLLCAIGLVLAITGGLSASGSPLAITPTAAVVAVLLFVVARRAGHQAFVWGSMLSAVVAYNFCPFFFRDLARQLVDSGAGAIAEERLPIAFYGLTYLPCIAALIAGYVYAKRRQARVFVQPIERFSMILSAVLFGCAFGHEKAVFPVAIAMTVLFAVQARVFGLRLLVLPAAAAFLIAALGAVPFAHGVFGMDSTVGMTFACGALAIAVLLPAERLEHSLVGSLVGSLKQVWGNGEIRAVALTGQLATITLVLAWPLAFTVGGFDLDGWGIAAGILGGVLAFVHAMRSRIDFLIGLSVVNVFALTAVLGAQYGASATDLSLALSAVLALQWGVSLWLERAADECAVAYHGVLSKVLPVAAAFLAVAIYLPVSVCELFGGEYGSQFVPNLLVRLLFTVLVVDIARVLRWNWVVVMAGMLVLASTGAALVAVFGLPAAPWSLGLWCALSIAALHLYGESTVIRWMSIAVFGSAVAASFLFYTESVVISGMVGTVGLYLTRRRGDAAAETRVLRLLNWQVFVFMVPLFGGAETLFDLSRATWLNLAVPIACVAVVSRAVWGVGLWGGVCKDRAGAETHVDFLLVVACAAMCFALFARLDVAGLVIGGATLALLAVSEAVKAIRQQARTNAWRALAGVVAIVGFYGAHDLIPFGSGKSQFVLLGTALVCTVVARVLRGSAVIFSRPLSVCGFWLPAVVALFAISRELLMNPSWLGAHSLALFFSAGFYFWHGIERRDRRPLIAALVIVNVALMLLWNELSLSDPQFYLIPVGITILGLNRMLKAEIPAHLHNPLCYLGALTILVSPTFHIIGGSWVHMFSLMLISVLVVFTAIGCRIRALMYTGSAFLIADLIAMVVRSSIDHPSILWIAGLLLGGAVIGLGAVAERHRELLLQRMRAVSARLEGWS